jgi:hypothetical protein
VHVITSIVVVRRTLLPLIGSYGYAKMWITYVYDNSHHFTIKGREGRKRSDDVRMDKYVN